VPVRVFVRPYASSLPLGFFSFGAGMLLLGGQANGWLHQSDQHTVGILLAAFVFPLEAIATVFAFLTRDTFGATGLGMFTTSWPASASPIWSRHRALSRALGLYEFGFAFAIVPLVVAAMSGKPLIGGLVGRTVGGLEGRRRASRDSLEGDLASQLRQLGDEARVRQTL
jgi:hypothetical protein